MSETTGAMGQGHRVSVSKSGQRGAIVQTVFTMAGAEARNSPSRRRLLLQNYTGQRPGECYPRSRFGTWVSASFCRSRDHLDEGKRQTLKAGDWLVFRLRGQEETNSQASVYFLLGSQWALLLTKWIPLFHEGKTSAKAFMFLVSFQHYESSFVSISILHLPRSLSPSWVFRVEHCCSRRDPTGPVCKNLCRNRCQYFCHKVITIFFILYRAKAILLTFLTSSLLYNLVYAVPQLKCNSSFMVKL